MTRAPLPAMPRARTPLRGVISRSLLGISEAETDMERRGFHTGVPGMRRHLESGGAAFVRGYNAALRDAGLLELLAELDATPRPYLGFAHEGAAMGLALLDRLTPWNRDRFAAFLAGPGEPHCYMLHVGAGWALARLPLDVDRFLARLDPLLRWLALDGFGFHEGFFRTARHTAGQPAPARVKGYGRRAFDQGLGRCLWFIHGGDVRRIAANILRFSEARRGDLFSGVGLAAAYAGEVATGDLDFIAENAGAFRPALAQGAAFAAKARLRAGNTSDYTDAATRALCGLPVHEAAALTDSCLEDLPDDHALPAFEIWRQRIQRHFAPALTP